MKEIDELAKIMEKDYIDQLRSHTYAFVRNLVITIILMGIGFAAYYFYFILYKVSDLRDKIRKFEDKLIEE
jgi:hypothetical protein